MLIQDLFEEYTNINLDRAYELFTQSYTEHTGTAWSKQKFLSRARDWKFYGDDNGYVAVRPQRSGMLKLVGAAGNPRSVMKGMRELVDLKLPIWGMMSSELIPMAKKFGMIQPPGFVIKMLMKIIPSNVWGDVPITVNKDGSITFSYDDVGDATKFFIASPEYFSYMLTNLHNNPMLDKLSDTAIKRIKQVLQTFIR